MWDSHNKVTYLWLLSIKAILSLPSPQPCWRYNGKALRVFSFFVLGCNFCPKKKAKVSSLGMYSNKMH